MRSLRLTLFHRRGLDLQVCSTSILFMFIIWFSIEVIVIVSSDDDAPLILKKPRTIQGMFKAIEPFTCTNSNPVVNSSPIPEASSSRKTINVSSRVSRAQEKAKARRKFFLCEHLSRPWFTSYIQQRLPRTYSRVGMSCPSLFSLPLGHRFERGGNSIVLL